jgi:hypothetical protein
VLGLRLNFFVATILFVAGIAWFIHSQRGRGIRGPRGRRGTALLA